MAMNIKYPRVDFFDPRTGNISREWNMFFLGLFGRTGSETGVSSTDLESVLEHVLGAGTRVAMPSGVDQLIQELASHNVTQNKSNRDMFLKHVEELSIRVAALRDSREDMFLKRIEALELRVEALEKRRDGDSVMAALREVQQFMFTN